MFYDFWNTWPIEKKNSEKLHTFPDDLDLDLTWPGGLSLDDPIFFLKIAQLIKNKLYQVWWREA